jgi:hypothetical protein
MSEGRALQPSAEWQWFAVGSSPDELAGAGFRLDGGGVHQSKTMMLRELGELLAAHVATGQNPRVLVLESNVLGKPTASARRIALARLRGLHGVGSTLPISRALTALWRLNPAGRHLLALLSALARDPLLRHSSGVVLPATLGASVRWPVIAAHFSVSFPGRFSPNMLKSLSQNCASTWTQSGHLAGRSSKVRAQVRATPATAAYAALLASLAGFGGPTLLASPWLRAVDCCRDELLVLLRQAATLGLARVRVAGDVVEIAVARPMAETLRVPELGEL